MEFLNVELFYQVSLHFIMRFTILKIHSSMTRTSNFASRNSTEAESLNEIQKKVFLLDIHSHLYSFALIFLFLERGRK